MILSGPAFAKSFSLKLRTLPGQIMKLPFPLEPGETVLLTARRHWLTFWPRFIALLLIAGLPSGLAMGFVSRMVPAHSAIWRAAAAIVVVWVLYWFARAAVLRYCYQRDFWTLTDRRLVAAHASAPFRTSARATALEEIQDISTHMGGVAGTVFGFGDVVCTTTRRQETLRLRQVPHPHDVALAMQQGCRDLRRSGSGKAPRPRDRPSPLRSR